MFKLCWNSSVWPVDGTGDLAHTWVKPGDWSLLVLNVECIVWCTCTVGLERLQQLLDALTDAGDVLVQHVYRVVDADDAFQTLQRLSRHDETTKHILIDLPTPECEQLLHRQVTFTVMIPLQCLVVSHCRSFSLYRPYHYSSLRYATWLLSGL